MFRLAIGRSFCGHLGVEEAFGRSTSPDCENGLEASVSPLNAALPDFPVRFQLSQNWRVIQTGRRISVVSMETMPLKTDLIQSQSITCQ